MASKAIMLDVPGPTPRQVRLSSPDRVLWPREQITKADLANYIIDVGQPLLRALGDRPVTLQRFPTGISGEEFFSKNPPRGVPEWARTTMCTYPPPGRSHPQLVIDEVATAVWAVQMNTLTFHPWPVRSADNDHPDEVRIDLDPQPGRSFADVITAAQGLAEVMESAGLIPFVKTSGSRGLHIYARVRPDLEFLDVRHAVIAIARRLERELPDLVTTAWWKEERGEKIFVDFNQANRDRTIASAYSPRPLPGAPVSMPVRWADLEGLDPGQFTLRTVPDLVATDGDAWADLDNHAGNLDTAMSWWQEDVDNGLGEEPFPPEYPKMPGEPPRVQPSKQRRAASEYDQPG